MFIWILFIPQSEEDIDFLHFSYAKGNGFKLFYCSDSRRGSTPNPANDILNVQSLLGRHSCSRPLCMHAFQDCDTASNIYPIGKLTAVVILNKDTELSPVPNLFCFGSCLHSNITSRKVMPLCTTACHQNALTNCATTVVGATSAKKCVRLERLPPTISSSK